MVGAFHKGHNTQWTRDGKKRSRPSYRLGANGSSDRLKGEGGDVIVRHTPYFLVLQSECVIDDNVELDLRGWGLTEVTTT